MGFKRWFSYKTKTKAKNKKRDLKEYSLRGWPGRRWAGVQTFLSRAPCGVLRLPLFGLDWQGAGETIYPDPSKNSREGETLC